MTVVVLPVIPVFLPWNPHCTNTVRNQSFVALCGKRLYANN